MTITYASAHYRVHRQWGSASQYPCVKCGKPAVHWAYDGTDPTQQHGHDSASSQRANALPMRYSTWPEFYMPMCHPCHRRMDLAELPRPFQRGRTGHGRGPTWKQLRTANTTIQLDLIDIVPLFVYITVGD